MIPKKAFMVKGVGVHKEKLASFELALRDAGIEKYNLVTVSSILPPNCEVIAKEEGLKELKSGKIVHCVLAKNQTNEPHRSMAASIGIAIPVNKDNYGYISEHTSFGEDEETAGEYAEDLAATMLATTLGIDFNAESAWFEREQVYKASGHIFETTHLCQYSTGDVSGKWTTVISVIVFIT